MIFKNYNKLAEIINFLIFREALFLEPLEISNGNLRNN